MTPESETLRNALCDVYRPWVVHVMEARGWSVSDAMADALLDGEAWLREELGALLAQPFTLQRRGPLELFQEAMRFPTEVLVEEGRDPVERAAAVVNALPGDIFDLAPASSAQLGDDVWQAHLRWGAAKAAAIVKPERT